jgi:Protein of unknown function (DUF3631)
MGSREPETLEATDPELPVEDRAADVWAPLVAIADLAGGDWPARARKAALVFTREADADAVEESLSVRLLADLRTVFTDPVMSSTRLVELLRRFPKPFGIRSISSRATCPATPVHVARHPNRRVPEPLLDRLDVRSGRPLSGFDVGRAGGTARSEAARTPASFPQ